MVCAFNNLSERSQCKTETLPDNLIFIINPSQNSTLKYTLKLQMQINISKVW